MDLVYYLSLGVGSIGVFIVVWGSLVTVFKFFAIEAKRILGRNVSGQRIRLRYKLSSYLLMGLEFMIGADIVRTIIRPTLEELALLGGLVVIRTVISYSLNKEMKETVK